MGRGGTTEVGNIDPRDERRVKGVGSVSLLRSLIAIDSPPLSADSFSAGIASDTYF